MRNHNRHPGRKGQALLRTIEAIQRHPIAFTAAGLAVGVLLGAKPGLRRGLGRALGLLARM